MFAIETRLEVCVNPPGSGQRVWHADTVKRTSRLAEGRQRNKGFKRRLGSIRWTGCTIVHGVSPMKTSLRRLAATAVSKYGT